MMSITRRLFTWSINLELLLFFVIFDRLSYGFTGNISRLLEFIVCVVLALQLIIQKKKWRAPAPDLYIMYLLFLSGVAVVSAYSAMWTQEYSLIGNSAVARFRPFLEYAIAIFYFGYFVMLPTYLYRTKEELQYFFKIFILCFFLSLSVGWLDLILQTADIGYIGRHLGDPLFVGFRFHGLAGEPRDAFVYLLLGLCLIQLYLWTKRQQMNLFFFGLILLSAILTKSASGVVGVFLFMMMVSFFELTRNALLGRYKNLLLFCSVPIVCIMGFIFLLWLSPRIYSYIDSLTNITDFSTYTAIPMPIQAQLTDVYPIYIVIRDLLDLNMAPVLLGHGIGSASVLNSVFLMDIGAVNNPRSMLARLLYENGLFGLGLYVAAFWYPLSYFLNKYRIENRKFVYLLLLVLACSLAHRSAAVYVFLGICLATIKIHAEELRMSPPFTNPVCRFSWPFSRDNLQAQPD